MSRAAASERALFLAIAAAAFAAVIAGLGARAIQRVAAQNDAEVRDFAIVRVVTPEGPEALGLARKALARSEHVRSAEQMSSKDVADILENLSGAAVPEENIPQVRLIQLSLAPIPDGVDINKELQSAMNAVGVTGVIMRNSDDQAAGGGVNDRTRFIAYWSAIFFALMMALVVALAARGYAVRRRDLLTIMADLGATRGRASGRVADEAARSGFGAGLLAVVIAAPAALFVLHFVVRDLSWEQTIGLLAPIDLVPLAVAPFAAAAAAAMGARSAAESLYDRAARLG